MVRRRTSAHGVGGITMLLVMALAQGGWGAEAPPEIEVGRPTLLGISGCSINAAVHSHGLPTTWVVEYGPTPQYGRQTKAESIPGRLAAHYRESWEEGWNGWKIGRAHV